MTKDEKIALDVRSGLTYLHSLNGSNNPLKKVTEDTRPTVNNNLGPQVIPQHINPFLHLSLKHFSAPEILSSINLSKILITQSLPWVMVLTDKIGNLAAQVGSKMFHPNIAEALKRGNLLSDNHWV